MAFSLNPRPVSSRSCLCHSDGVQGALTLFTDVTWKTFKDAALDRKDTIYENMEGKWDAGPFGSYHRSCYQMYTSRSHIERVLRKRRIEEITDDEEDSEMQIEPSLTRSSLQSTNIKSCVICQEEKADPKDRRRKERLTTCQTFTAGETLVNAAKFRGDQRLTVALEGQDLIAMEVCYHRSCYRRYTNVKSPEESKNQNDEAETEIYDEAFQELKNEVEIQLIQRLEVLRMSSLREKYVELLSHRGVNNPEYRSEKLKSRLRRSFGEKVSFWHPRHRSETELVYYDDIPKGQVVECGYNQSFEEEICHVEEDKETGNHIYHCAKIVRAALLKYEVGMPWPPSAIALKQVNFVLPPVVYNLLAWIFTEDEENQPIDNSKRVTVNDPAVHRLILSLGQDLVYNISKGRQKTPKHVALPMTIKNLTGCKEVITLLNRFGHGISYEQVLSIETVLAEKQMETEQQGVILPSNIQPNVFSMFCWDNIDLLEETLSGKGTSHCTNGIIVQRQVSWCEPPPSQERQDRRGRRRTLQTVPSQVYQYNAGRRCGPGAFQVDVNHYMRGSSDVHYSAKLKDFAWFLSRLPPDDGDHLIDGMSETPQSVPGWSGFNTVAKRNDVPGKSTVGYCQLIDASPTELSTVYTLLKKSVTMANRLGLEETVIVLDQAIYAKALEVIWKQQQQFKSVVLMMGDFHVACVFLAVLGKRFGNAGLRDLLIESRIVGSGSLNGVLEGRHYNRALRIHKIIVEALIRLNWHSFIQSASQDRRLIGQIEAVEASLQNVRQKVTSDSIQALFDNAELKDVLRSFEEFNLTTNGKMSQYWQSYIEMVTLLLRFIRATREGDWNLHLACITDMLPWMFAYDRTNYARYLPVYLCDMLALEQNHPSAYEAIEAGDFVVQRSSWNGFGQVAVDQTIEQTINCDTKSKGGIIGFSLNKSAVQRWVLTSHERAAVTQACREMAGSTDNDEGVVKEMGKARLSKDEEDVRKVHSTLSTWINPFSPTSESDEICHLASGMTADERVEQDLLTAHDRGKEAMMGFIQKRLVSSEVGFYDPIPKLKLVNFTSVAKAFKISGKDVTLQADRNLFARLLVIAQTRDMDLREVFKHSLGPLPWSLASTDGTLGKTDKSKLLEPLTNQVEPAEDVPPTAAWIVDGMAILQSLKEIPPTFEDLAMMIFDLIAPPAMMARRIDFVTDRYLETSIKNPERTRRCSHGSLKVRITGPKQKCPKQWKKFLSNGENKTSLTEFLLQQWSGNSYANRIGRRIIFFAAGDLCRKLFVFDGKVISEQVEELKCTHEEADTRILLHAKHAADHGEGTIVIKSPDSDVIMLTCHFQNKIPSRLLVHKNLKTRTIFLDIPAIVLKAGVELCETLPGLHSFTGCDTTSSFAGKGKKGPLKLCMNDRESRQAMSLLGRSFALDATTFKRIEKFVCRMYGLMSDDHDDVNECRYLLFCTKNQQSQSLPPCQDALEKHTQRANYQAAIWRRALEANPRVPSPDGYGWTTTDDGISIDWMSLPPAPEALLDMIVCGCTGFCTTGHCSCNRNSLSCTDACQCGDSCNNPHNMWETNDLADDSDVE